MQEKGRELWERLPDETNAAWRAFREFRNRGPERTKLGVYRDLYDNPDAQLPHRAFQRWIKQYAWDERARAWDRAVDLAFFDEVVQDQKARARRHTQMLQAMQMTALEALNTTDPSELTRRDIKEWILESIEKERLVAGEATERVDGEVHGSLGVNLNVEALIRKFAFELPMEIVQRLAEGSPEEVESLLDELAERGEQRLLSSGS